MRVSWLKVILLNTCLFASVSWGAIPSVSMQSLLDANQGMRAMARGERIVALYGVPFASDANPTTTTDDFVAAFLAEHGDGLGVDNLQLALDNQINIRNDKFTVYTYIQQIEGLPVYASVVKIPVLLGATEKIGYVGMYLMQNPDDPLPLDVLTEAEAIAVVQQSPDYANVTTFSGAEKVIFEGADTTLHRVWRFWGSGDEGSFLFFVDTNNGNIVSAVDPSFDAVVDGTVTGWATPGIAADTETNPPEQVPLPGVTVNLLSGVEYTCPSEEGPIVAQELTLPDGTYGFTGEVLPARVMTSLTGEWVSVFSCDGLTVYQCELALQVFGNLEQETRCADVPGDPVDFVFNAPPHAEFDTSQVNAFLGVEATHAWFKDLQDTFTGIDRNLPCAVNVSLWNNAQYSPWPGALYFGGAAEYGGSTWNSWAMSTMISHEYGHVILYELLDLDFNNMWHRVFHEGVADTVATLKWDTELVGLDVPIVNGPFSNPPTPEGATRNVDEPDVRLGGCGSQADWCTPCGLHCYSLPLSGAFWDLRKKIFDQATEELFADFLFITDGSLDESVLVEVLIADDDDADLSNGTPNCSDILWAFVGHSCTAIQGCDVTQPWDSHGWSCPISDPDGSVKVGWVGPIEPYQNPEEGVDYFVHYDVSPPNITLKTTARAGVDVGGWQIGRVDPQSGDPLDLGTVYANWDVGSNDIIVEVGSSTDPNMKCRNLNVVEIAPESAGNWSSIVLNLTGDLVGRTQCYAVQEEGPTKGDGGRVSGMVAGNAKRVFAEGIGVGALGAGALGVGGTLRKLDLAGMQAGSALTVSGVEMNVDVVGDWLGSLEVLGFPVLGDLTGDILIDGDIGAGGSIYFAGDTSGDIVADADGDGNGAITGTVVVDGVFNGDICGANLAAGLPLPENISLATIGPDATQCDGALITCGARYTGSSGDWQDVNNWNGALPDSTTIVCIPADTTITVSDNPSYPLNVEALAIHIVGAGQSGSAGTLILENLTSLTIHADSTIAGSLIMEPLSTLNIAADLTITGYGGEIEGSFDTGSGESSVIMGGAQATLTIAGNGADRSESLVVHGSPNIQVSLNNNAYVVADGAEPLTLSGQSKTSSAGGFWIAEQDPVTQSVGQLNVNVEVTGVGRWMLVDHANARIIVNTPCYNLTGPVDLTQGTLEVNANFWTSGDLLMQSVSGSEPAMQIAAGKSAKFGN